MNIRRSFLCSLFFFSSFVIAENSPVGMWTTIDDKTKQPKSKVEIISADGILSGKIIELFNPSEPNPLCTKCKGEKNNQPILGMTIIWNAIDKGKHWKGKILDPKKGKTYKLKLSLIEDGQKLKIRGYIGNPLLGRTQIWQRAE
ncbi:MAG: DUF2147 domain-containing protein [Cellvibrionaceae bacterium]